MGEGDNRKGFGYDADMTAYILQFVRGPKELQSLSQVNKLIRSTISLEMVVTACMVSGGRTLQSIVNLEPRIRCRSVRVPSALRLLRVCNMKRCEFCGNVDTPDVMSQSSDRTGKEKRNAKPRYIRPAWGCMFPCWTCLTKNRDSSISRTWPYPCLNRAWHRVPFPNGKRPFNRSPDMEYESNRELYDSVFSHPQAASYVYGDQGNDGRNGWEILWSFPMQDASGEYISPLLTFQDIDPLIRYLKTPGNLGISHYLEHSIPDPSPVEDYQRFATVFDSLISCKGKQRKKNKKIVEDNRERRLNKIEKAVKAIGLVIRFVNESHLAPLQQPFFNYRSSFEQVVGDVQRLLLCYMEVHQTFRKYCLEYDTGHGLLDKALMDLLDPVIRKPEHLTRSEAKTYATRTFKLWLEREFYLENVSAMFHAPWHTRRRTDFNRDSNPRIRRPTGFRHTRAVRWRDTRRQRLA